MKTMKDLEGKNWTEILTEIANTNESCDAYEKAVWYFMNSIMGVKTRVVCGIVYVNGAMPTNIHTACEQTLNALKQEGMLEAV